MSNSAVATGAAPRRDRRGRFLTGASGNPAGRPAGILNEATRAAAVLLGGEAGALTRKAIELALAGDIAALRLCLDRIIAPQREQPAGFALPAISEPGDVAVAMTALSQAAASGDVAPQAAVSLARMLEAQARVIERMARLEAARLAEQRRDVAVRMELRVCVVMAYHVRAFEPAREIDWRVDGPVGEMLRLGRDAGYTLAMIPDTLALVAADEKFIAAHPLPLLREPNPIAAEMAQQWDGLSRFLDEGGTLDWLERRVAENAAEAAARGA
jgi:hypothetical protein